MKPKEEEYTALTKKNQRRLYITLLLALIVIILAFIVLKPYKTGDTVDAADKSPAVHIVSQKNPEGQNTVKKERAKVKTAKTSSSSRAEKKARAETVYALKPLVEVAGIEATPPSAPESASTPTKKTAAELAFPGTLDKKLNPHQAEAKNKAAPVAQNQIVTVQVASLTDPIKAEALRARLKKFGFPARVETFTGKGTTYYRVRVGAFSDRDKANQILSRLRREGFPASVVR